MHNAPPPRNALRAFEAAARHLSLTKAAVELNVTPGALSHQIRGLEDHLGLKLFDRGVRSIALTGAGRALKPGLQAGFLHIRDALASLNRLADARVLVISAPPGFTSKWLAPVALPLFDRHPEIDVRVSSSIKNANFTTDGVDAAVRNLRVDAARNCHSSPRGRKADPPHPSRRSAALLSSKNTGPSCRRTCSSACR